MKLYFMAVLTLSSLIATAQACSQGCLRCDSSNSQCIVCDFKKNYAPDASGKCVVSSITGCVSTDANGGCYICDNGRYYDQTTKTCPLARTSITNCRKYSGPQTCSTCFAGYYLNNNACVQISAGLISNCVTYSSATKCVECGVGSIPNIDGNFCTQVNVETCSNYRNYQCKKCDTTQSIMNLNAYLIRPYDNQDTSTIRQMVAKLSRDTTSTLIHSVCVQTTVPNCEIYSAYNKCYMCSDGYFLTDSFTCQQYSLNNMSGCQDFKSASVCDTCTNGYYKSGDGCAGSTEVSNCLNYSSTADACEECTTNYYLNNAKCSLRANIIATCKTYDASVDKCTVCNDGYALSSDAIKCFALPSDCAQSGSVNDSTGEVTCALCKDGYYLNGSTCSQGTVSNCKTYQTSTDVCAVCESRYRIDNQSCVPITLNIDNCEAYAPNGPARCQTCDFKSVLYNESSVCEAQANILNCISYTDKNNCASCKPGYVINNNACELIPESEHCLTKSLGVCTLCQPQYNLNDQACSLVPDQLSANCSTSDTSALGIKYQCIGCDAGYVPVSNLQEICISQDSLTINTIDNCANYTNNNGSISCKQCNLSYTLSNDQTQCLEVCPQNETVYMGILNTNNNQVQVEAYSKCVDTSDYDDLPEGCAYASHNLTGDGNVCLACSEGYIPVEQCSLDTTFFNINNLQDIKEGQAFPVVSCVKQVNESVFVPTSSAPDSDCLYYTPIGNKFYCSQCLFGITGAITVDDSGQVYVDCSITVENCDTETRFGTAFDNEDWIANMYGFNLSYHFTCHHCSNDGEIPFIHLTDSLSLHTYEINKTDTIPSASQSHSGQITVCRNPNQLVTPAPGNTSTFVANCALGIIITDVALSVGTADPSVRCLACKDGYAPVYDNNKFHITSCSAVSNCSPSDTYGWLNGCKTCAKGSNKVITADGKVDPKTCQLNSQSDNCRIYNSQTKKCAICERGYNMDNDDICTKFTFPLCSNFAMRASLPYMLSDDTINYSYVYYFGATGFDCYQCQNGYVLAENVSNGPACALHPAIESQSNSGSSKYQAHCSSYYSDDKNQILCQQCSQGYIVSKDHKSCLTASVLSGCKLDNDNGPGCNTCLTGYILGGGACYPTNIDNCSQYAVNSGAVSCTSCSSGFKKDSNGGCVAGTIDNCGTYDDDGDCTKCKDNFYLFFKKCVAIPTTLNCNVASLNNVNNVFQCTSCNAGYFLNNSVVSTNQNLCIQGPITDNCVSYDNNFVCKNCSDGYYLNQSKCTQRANIVENCNVYDSDKDSCGSCNSGYILGNNTCTKPTTMVQYCEKYSSSNTCSLCSRGRYLNNGSCSQVSNSNLVTNCNYYSSATQCQKCDMNYLLIGNSCLEKVVKGCASYVSASVCATCPSGYIFKTISPATIFTRDCVLPETTIQNCYDVNSSLKSCRTCNKGYYLNANRVCTEVPNPIDNCRFYKTAITCDVCQVGAIRSLDGKVCTIDTAVQSIEPLCTDLRYNTVPSCSACKPGYYFNSSTCVACASNKTSQGCMYCNPSDNTKCLVCMSGYNMSNNGQCSAGLTGIESDNLDDLDESARFMGITVVLFALMFLLVR